jgi:organic hydroperoxide reductase OsmC/OhrA
MATHGCTLEWSRGAQPFTDLKYSRAHTLRFDGGAVVPASSSPHSVRLPYSDAAGVDPEEALVAAVASCHMLWFLSLAAEAGYVVDRYEDAPQGTLGLFDDGRRGITQVMLHPQVSVGGTRRPADAIISDLHRAAHERCDIANSLRGVVRIDGQWQFAG